MPGTLPPLPGRPFAERNAELLRGLRQVFADAVKELERGFALGIARSSLAMMPGSRPDLSAELGRVGELNARVEAAGFLAWMDPPNIAGMAIEEARSALNEYAGELERMLMSPHWKNC